LEATDLKASSHLYDDLGIDSLGMFSLGMKLIKIYEVNLPLAIVATIETVGDLYAKLEEHTGKSA
jgi:acyl carrier protein